MINYALWSGPARSGSSEVVSLKFRRISGLPSVSGVNVLSTSEPGSHLKIFEGRLKDTPPAGRNYQNPAFRPDFRFRGAKTNEGSLDPEDF